MKKLFFVILAVLSVLSVSAADKKLTVIVMDTTQALLDKAEIKVGKTVYTTSFDGRIVLERNQIKGVKKLFVSREGFVATKINVNGSETIVVVLQPKRVQAPKQYKEPTAEDAGVYYTLGASKSAAHYERELVSPRLVKADEMPPAVTGDVPPVAGGVAVNTVSAGKLTAGEVNDFAKWYFWHKVIDGSHKEFISDWQMSPRMRYTVQVMTRAGAPVASRAVSLLDERGNTLFQAVTDNTGKAELWGNLMAAKGNEQGAWKIRVDKQTTAAKPWTEGMNTVVLDEECEVSDAVDVMFVFDATGSMGDELRYLQAEMRDVIARAKDATGGLNIRTGAVVYRDHGDEYITRISRLTEDIKTTQAFIDKQHAAGGGDYPEAIPEALMAALNSAGWDSEARARIAFLVLDAPCHQDSVTLALLHDQVLNAAASGVRIVPVVCSGLKESGEYLMRAIALATNGTSFFLTDDSGIGHSHLKPTTDSLKVEHLNDMLVRTIVEFSSMPACHAQQSAGEELTDNERFIPNPFSAEDLEKDPKIPHGEGVNYLVDVTGKLLGVYMGDVPTEYLPIGVYFIKSYVDGQWFTKKILINK